MQKKFYLNKIILSALISLLLSVHANAAGPTHFTDFVLTDTNCAYAGKVTINNGQGDINAVDYEDEVGVFVSDGSGGEILIGACVIGDVLANHFYVQVYGDDTTSPEKDGAKPNDELIFKVWDKSMDKEDYAVSYSYESSGGVVEPEIPPKFTPSVTYGLLRIAAKANRNPVLDSIRSKTVIETNTLTFSISGSDPDEDTITFSAQDLPTGANFDAASKTFSWTPGYEDSGTYSVTFTVTDDGEPQLSTSETIEIKVDNKNRSPNLEAINNKEVDEDKELTFYSFSK